MARLLTAGSATRNAPLLRPAGVVARMTLRDPRAVDTFAGLLDSGRLTVLALRSGG